MKPLHTLSRYSYFMLPDEDQTAIYELRSDYIDDGKIACVEWAFVQFHENSRIQKLEYTTNCKFSMYTQVIPIELRLSIATNKEGLYVSS